MSAGDELLDEEQLAHVSASKSDGLMVRRGIKALKKWSLSSLSTEGAFLCHLRNCFGIRAYYSKFQGMCLY